MRSRALHRIELPDRLKAKLFGFRRALLVNTFRDAVVRLVLSAAVAFCALLLLDRFIATPSWLRLGLLLAVFGVASHAAIQFWFVTWRCRTPLRIAEFIRRYDPLFGDHLIGGLELAESAMEQARSEQLCEAALGQVADEAEKHDFHQALPPSPIRVMVVVLAALAVVTVGLSVSLPELVMSGARRLTNPFGTTPRFTFVSLSELPAERVVPRDEVSFWAVELSQDTRWSPRTASLSVGQSELSATVNATDETTRYKFEIPRLYETAVASLRVGDVTAELKLVPKLRPQIREIAARVRLPDYLRAALATDDLSVDVVNSTINIIEGGTVSLRATASSRLKHASIAGQPARVSGDRFSATLPRDVESVQLNWVDTDGLAAVEPMTIKIQRVADQAPRLAVESESIPARVLESRSLRFSVEAGDDFSLRRVGMEWSQGDEKDEQVLGQGRSEVTLSAVFQASTRAIHSGEVQLRFWAEDHLPGRPRVYSDPITMNVLSKDEHAVWIAGQFARWRQSAMDVRDRELNLFAQNRELAQATAEQRDEAWRAAVAEQARAEEFNGRQLKSLSAEGESLLRQAARNEEVDVEYVEQLAETIKSLEQMADSRMPRVAELLEQAAEEESQFAEMIDQESTQGNLPSEPKAGDAEQEQESTDASERVGLAGTTIMDTSKRKDKEQTAESEEDKLALAVEDQTELVAEFDAVAEELEALLGNMEGSTLVKRLKSVSRQQDRVAMRLSREIESTFGRETASHRDAEPASENESTPNAAQSSTQSLTDEVADSASRVRTVLDDLEAFCERRDIEHYASVLEEMKTARVLEQLKRLRTRVSTRPGTSIAMAEFWADNLDRWADDLVDPGEEEPESGPQNNASLPPSVVVEVLRILEGEVDLREQTRVAEQGRTTMADDKYMGEAVRLSEAQDLLRDRVDLVVDKIEGLPNGELNFAGEMEVLAAASAAMVDATKTLVSPETGPAAIAAQTEAIELLLRSRKITPEGDGGGGGSAGGGAGGETDEPAIALLGRGLNELAKARDSETLLSVGGQRADVPEKWRKGLDEYFNQLEQRTSRRSDGGRP